MRLLCINRQRPRFGALPMKSLFFTALEGLHTIRMIQNPFADTQCFRSYFQKFVVSKIFQALFQAHLLGGNQSQRVVRTRGAGIGQMLGLAHVDGDILHAGIGANDHALVHRDSGAYE